MSASVRAPALDAGLGWLNTDRPLQLDGELRGQVVILDFWTYCCMNCMHILPDLAYLEEKYARDPVAFIGVHSAKFTNEASRETIRAAIFRYEIAHPVVIDDDMKIWRSYAVRSWPTLVVIDSTGHIVGVAAGEGNRDVIDNAIAQALKQGRADGTLADAPLTVRRESSVRSASALKFPGKILVDQDAGRLYVCDSNHNRIVIAELPDKRGMARVVKVVGSGSVGMEDGQAEQATFHHPQGLIAGQGNLYVADTENHLIRAIDLTSYEVRTVVGTGKMDNDRAGGGMGVTQGLNSPWDLAIEGSTLFAAMAGVHQLWRIDLPVGFARAFAGSGRENLVDGPAETAALAQPSGICAVGGKLYFADSEVSAIRGIDMNAEQVFTVIGEGLFSFGDVDGAHPQAKLQHPLGVDSWGELLVVADTYNHKIKVLDPASRSLRTLCGSGSPGTGSPGEAVEFFEPGGVSVAGDEVYVADTNNHRIVRVDLKTGDWAEVVFDGLETPAEAGFNMPDVIAAAPVSIATGQDIELTVNIKLPSATHLSLEAPWSIRVSAGDATIAQQTGKSAKLPLRMTIPASAVVVDRPWRVTASFAYCTESDRGLCVPMEATWSTPVVGSGDSTVIELAFDLDTV